MAENMEIIFKWNEITKTPPSSKVIPYIEMFRGEIFGVYLDSKLN